ncbi:MAG: hypothetical protein JXA03_04860 [Bacteroidales bacterium]|nr:hypothetical protein [Bacteroidales bacterium]
MGELLRYKQVNWVNGMKINRNHFISLENFILAYLHDRSKAMLNSYSYGLLPALKNEQKSVNFDVIFDNQQIIRVKINSCSAITLDGYRIEILEEEEKLSRDFDQVVEGTYDSKGDKSVEFYLVLTIDPFNRIPVGMTDVSDDVLKHSSVVPKYHLDIIPRNKFKHTEASASIVIGKIDIINNELKADLNFIPPCTSVRSHHQLMNYHSLFDKKISALEEDCVRLLKKIRNIGYGSDLTNAIEYTTEKIIQFLNFSLFRYRNFIVDLPPVFLIGVFSDLARTIKNAMDSLPSKENEILLNYLSNHFDISPSRMANLLESIVNIEYVHTNIFHSYNTVESFLTNISKIFHKLPEMEFVVDRTQKPQESDKRIKIR